MSNMGLKSESTGKNTRKQKICRIIAQTTPETLPRQIRWRKMISRVNWDTFGNKSHCFH